MMNRIKSRLACLFNGLSRDEGTTAVEFALMLPLFMAVFTSAFESGMLMTRSIMLEQAVDMTMRELRLGHYVNPTAALLKAEICDRSVILKDCEANIAIEMTRIDTSTFVVPQTPITCVNRTQPFAPPEMTFGQRNDVILIRVCVVQDMLFPGPGLGLHLPIINSADKKGYGITTSSAFVTEPY